MLILLFNIVAYAQDKEKEVRGLNKYEYVKSMAKLLDPVTRPNSMYVISDDGLFIEVLSIEDSFKSMGINIEHTSLDNLVKLSNNVIEEAVKISYKQFDDTGIIDDFKKLGVDKYQMVVSVRDTIISSKIIFIK